MKKLLSLIVVMLLTVSMAHASAVRVGTMGDNSQIVKDASGVSLYPQTILNYPNIMYTTIDGASQWLVGGNYVLPVGTLGLIFKQGPNGQDNNTYFPNVPIHGGGASPVIDQKLDLIYGYDMGEMSFGLGLSLYGNSYVRNYTKVIPNDKTEISASGIGINIGATIAKNLDAAITFNMMSFVNNAADGKVITEGTGNTEIGVTARYWMEMSPKYTLIPHIGFGLLGEGETQGPGSATNGDKVEISTMVLQVGIGNNMNFNENVMAVADVGIEYMPTMTTVTPTTAGVVAFKGIETHTAMPYFNLGLEGKVFTWMDIRLGVTKKWASHTTDALDANDGDTEQWGFVQTDMKIGAGFHFNALNIDAEINPGFLTNGPNFISGASAPLAAKVALTYTFDAK